MQNGVSISKHASTMGRLSSLGLEMILSRSLEQPYISDRIIAATIIGTWAILNIEAEFSDFSETQYFVSVGLCAAYWLCALNPSLHDIGSIVAPERPFVSMRVLPGAVKCICLFSIDFNSYVQ